MRYYLSVKSSVIPGYVPEYRAHLIIAQTQKYPLDVDFPAYVQLVKHRLGHCPALSLEYLHNHQLGSQAGVRGWIGWSGRVGCELLELPVGSEPFDTYTISTDWKTVAQAYPFLQLQAQVHGHGGNKLKLLGQWEISGGKAKYCAPENVSPWDFSEHLAVKERRRALEAQTIPPEKFQLGASEDRLDLAAANIASLLR